MDANFPVTLTSRSRRDSVDYGKLAFGQVFSDHMFSMEYRDGAWGPGEILPYAPIPMEPGTAMLHYGYTVFEGLKAFYGADGTVRAFRPDMNAKRLYESAQRLCMPTVEPALFLAAVDALVRVDWDWIPRGDGQSLYVRPLLIGTEAHLDVRPDNTFRFLIMTSPVGSYFGKSAKGVSLKAEDQYTRAAASGGLGFAKTAANYAAALYAAVESQRQGYDQVIWLDGMEHRYVEEVGAMNIFFKLKGTVVTPPLSGSILPGVTRNSVLQLLRDQGHAVEERRIAMDEVMDGMRSGGVEEVFGAGTAAVISPVERIHFKGETLRLANVPGPLTQHLYDQITGIQTGRLADPHGWCHVVEPPAAKVAAPAAQAVRA